MDNNNQQERDQQGWQSQGESLNTGSAENANTGSEERNESKGGSALQAASVGRSATDAVRSRTSGGSGRLANTGTNVSYEGETAPGAGGSVGSGYASGRSAVDASIETNSEYQAAAGRATGGEDADEGDIPEDKEKDII